MTARLGGRRRDRKRLTTALVRECTERLNERIAARLICDRCKGWRLWGYRGCKVHSPEEFA